MHVAQPSGGEVTLLDLNDSRYPALLRHIPDPPRELYIRGDPALLQRPMLAMVGARRASAAGLQAAASLARNLGELGLGVCSGLALGIDAAAHRAALDCGAVTVAVMGTGIDAIYPRRNRQLGEQIAGSGCLVTEFPPGEPPRPGHFPRRNRIISGLSLGVIVVEAALRSGSLITARMATEQGREVFALPWSIAHDGGSGCLHLLRDGAKMVQGVEDVLEELGPLYSLLKASAPAAPIATGGPEGAGSLLLGLIGDTEVAIDELARLSGLPVAQLLGQLSALELAGAVARGPAGYHRLPGGGNGLPSGRRSG